jgi:hypothetical protein
MERGTALELVVDRVVVRVSDGWLIASAGKDALRV